MPPTVNQEINVNINALVKRIQDVRELVQLIRSLRETRGSGPVLIDDRISKNAKASSTEVDRLNGSIQSLIGAVDKLDEKQPTRLGQGLRTLSSIVQGLAAAGQAVDFVKSWIPGFETVKQKGSEAFSSVKDKVLSLAATGGAKGSEFFASLSSGAQTLLGSLRGVVSGSGEAVASLGTTGIAVGALTGGVLLLVAAIAALAIGFVALVTATGGMTAALVTLGTIGLLPLLKFGAEYNAQIEQGKLGVAAIIASLAQFRDQAGRKIEGPEALNASLALAQGQINKLKVDAVNTIATFGQILPAFQAALGPGLKAGLGLDEIRQITVRIVQAAGAIGLPANQIAQEVRAILEGTITEDARLAKILGISNDLVKKWREQGTLAEELNKRLETFGDAGVLAAQTLDGITSNLEEAVNVFTGEATERSFERLKIRIAGILEQIFDFKKAGLNDSFTALATFVDNLFVRAIDLAADFVEDVISGVRQISGWLEKNRGTVDQILATVGDIVSEIGFFALELAKVAAHLLGNKNTLIFINNALSFTKSLVAVIGLTVLGIVDAFAAVVRYVTTQLNPVLSITLGLAAAVARALRLPGSTPANAPVDPNDIAGGDGVFRKKVPDFTVPPAPASSGKKKGSGQKPPDVSGSAFELEKTRLQSLFDLEKDLLDRRLAQLKDHFDRARSGFLRGFEERRLTITEFYAEQTKLQTEAVEKELRLLSQLRLARQTEFVQKAGVIEKEDKGATRKNKLAIEENKLQKDLTEIDEKRLKLLRDRQELIDKNQQDEEIATEALKRQFDEVIDQIDALNGHTAKLEIGNILRSLNPLLEDLKKNFGDASTEARLLQQYIDLLVNHAQVGEVLNRLSPLQDQLQIERLGIEQKINQHVLTQRQGRRELYQLEQKYLDLQLVELNNALAIAQSEKDKLAIKLQIAEVETAKSQQFVDETASSINGRLKDSFVDFFASIADGTKSVKKAFADLGLFILQMFARLAAQRLVENLFGNLFGDSKGQGGIGGVLSGIFGGKKAAGDMMSARPGGQLIQVAEAGYDELVVSTDPRYASRTAGLLGAFIRRTGIVPDFAKFATGGFARSIANSFHIPRLAAGAFVSPPGPQAALAGIAGAEVSLNERHYHVWDPRHIHREMASPGGQDAIWHFIDQNATLIKRRLK